MPNYFPDVDDELRDLEQMDQRRRSSDARLGVTSDESGKIQLPTEQEGARLYALVYDLSQWQKKYPWMKADVVKALAQYGVDPNTPQGRAIAEVGAKVKMDSGLYFYDLGKAIAARNLKSPGFNTPGQRSRDADSMKRAAQAALGIAGQGLGTAYVGADDSFQYLRDVDKNRYVKGSSSLAYEFTEGEDAPVTGQKISDVKGGSGGSMQLAATGAHLKEASVVSAVTPVIRTGMMVLDAPLQELQGQFRNVVSGQPQSLANWESQSDLGIALGNLSRGEQVDVGTGIFVDPKSAVVKERIRRALERGNIGGHTITPGRWVADLVFEPGSREFSLLSGLTDASVAIAADPSNIALGGAAKARAANKLFTEAGGIFGLRKTVSPTAVEKWLDGKPGTEVAEWLATHNDPYELHKMLGKRAPIELLPTLADETDPNQIKDILRPYLGTAIQEKPSVPTALEVARSKPKSRMWGIVPSDVIDLDDAYDSAIQVERSLQNMNAPSEMVGEWFGKMARATDRVERYDVLEGMWGGAKGLLVQQGFSPDQARSLTKMFRDSHEGMFLSFVDERGNPVKMWSDRYDDAGRIIRESDPGNLVEAIGRTVPLPDARALRRATTTHKLLRAISATKEMELRLPVALLDAGQQKIWKPMALLRGAWTIRVVGEEQVRMAASGLDSLFNHPISAIAWITGRKGNVTMTGESFADVAEASQALTRGSAGMIHAPGTVTTGQWRLVDKTPETMSDYTRAWANEIAELHADPIHKKVAQFDNLEDAQAWFRGVGEDGARGQHFREMMAKMGHPELLADMGANSYIAKISRWNSVKSAGDSTLLNAIITGRLNGEAIDLSAIGRMQLNPKFVSALEAYTDIGPQTVKGVSYKVLKGGAIKDRMDRITETAFTALMSWHTNKLSRNPTFRQFYWNEAPTLMPHMTIDAQQALIANARAAGIRGSQLRALRKARHSTGTLTLDDADLIARGHALDNTKNLLYDLSERHQFFDAVRMLAPFGEAWFEIFTRWGQIASNRPQVIRRAQQLIQGARGPDFGEFMGAPTTVDPETGKPVQQGFFYTDSRGEEVFVYPGSEWLTSKLMGVPVPLVGRTEGLNMMGQVFPALGPVAQIPAGYFLPDTPAFDAVNDIVFPYGRPKDPTSISYWAPAWMKRILSKSSDDPQDGIRWANTVMDVARYLSSTGDYDTSTAEGQQKLLADAKNRADKFYWIRSFAQFVAPSSPSPEWLVETSGKEFNGLISSAILAQEFRLMQEANYETAAQDFLAKYGEDAFMTMQSKTHAVVYGYPVTEEGNDWLQTHSQVQKDYPNVYGFFAPQGGEFSYPAYLRAIRDGAKQPLTPEQFVKLSNARLASIQYGLARDELMQKTGGKPSDEQYAWLRQVKDILIREYPGYGELIHNALGLQGGSVKDQAPELIRQLTATLDDPELSATDTGIALRVYLDARSQANEAAITRHEVSSFAQAKSAKYLRDWLRQIGNTLALGHPNFAPLWEQVLESEMNDDTDWGEK